MARRPKSSKKKIGAPVLHRRHRMLPGHVGATEIYVAVSVDRDPQPVRGFSTFTADLYRRRLAESLQDPDGGDGIDGRLLDPIVSGFGGTGFTVLLVNARHVKHVPGRKSDVSDCQWLQYLHTVGLLRDRSGRNRRSARCARSSATGTAWCRWPRLTCNTCKRLWTR